MASKPKAPMPTVERAKQFLPFAALKGLEEALERKERDGAEQKEIAGQGPAISVISGQ